MSIISLRKTVQGPVGKILMAFLFLTMFAGFGLSRIFSKFFKGFRTDYVALVNGNDISQQALREKTTEEEQRLSAIRQRYGTQADLYLQLMGLSSDAQTNALLELIHSTLLDNLANQLSVVISPEYVEARVADQRFLYHEVGHLLPQELISKNGVDVSGALAFLRQTGQMEFIVQKLKEQLKKQFTAYLVHSTFFIPEFTLKELCKEKMLAKKYAYQIFDLAIFLAQQKIQTVTDDKLRSFYNEHNKMSKRYWAAESRDVNMWTFSPDAFGITVTAEEVQNYYAKHRSTRFIKDPVQIQVREIVFGEVEKRGLKALKEEADQVYAQLLQNPQAFKAMVKQYSTKKESAEKEGLVDYFKKSTKDKEYERAAFKLKEDGEISPVIETSDGFVILQRVARKEPSFELLDSVKGVIEKSLLEQKFKTDFLKQTNELIRSGELTPEIFAAFVSAHQGVKDTLKGIKKSANTMISQRLFALRSERGMNAFIKEGKGIVIELAHIKKATVLSFDEVKAQVIKDYQEAEATKALEQSVKEAKKEAIKHNKLVSIAGQKIQMTDFINPTDTKVVEEFIKKGFPSSFTSLSWNGALLTDITEKNGIIIRLEDVETVSQESFENKKQGIFGEALREWNMLDMQAFIASLYRNATIEINNELSRVKDQL